MNLTPFDIEQLNKAAASGCYEAKVALNLWARSLRNPASLKAVTEFNRENSGAIPKLLPCPMCGGSALFRISKCDSFDDQFVCAVSCSACGISSRDSVAPTRSCSQGRAAVLWNRRAPTIQTTSHLAETYGPAINESLREQRASDREKLMKLISEIPNWFIGRDKIIDAIRTANLD